jgi:hypothetical protein
MSVDTFIGQCLRGEADAEGIDAFIARWHTGTDARPLHAALGMTKSEYARWVHDPAELSRILAAHAIRARPIRKELVPA